MLAIPLQLQYKLIEWTNLIFYCPLKPCFQITYLAESTDFPTLTMLVERQVLIDT